MRVVVTGAAGFLGWHTRARLCALTDHEVVPVSRDNWFALSQEISQADAVIHVAGVNRGQPEQVRAGNIRLAEDVGVALRSGSSCRRVIYANSIQAGNDTPYGNGKELAGEVLATAARATGATYLDVGLPNLFGEHGRPHYNSFVATFVDAAVRGESPPIQDRSVALLHVQDAAQALIDGLTTRQSHITPSGTETSVQEVYDALVRFRGIYESGDIPPLLSKFDVDLFNTLRAGLFPKHYPIPLQVNADDRGRLVETVRAHGGQGQTFVSTTRPGVTRGEHFHLHKVERFVVLSGRARMSLRRLFHHDVVSFEVSGDQPVVVDMPTMWAHNITNTGDSEVTTLFWTHTLFDPDEPDTYRELVQRERERVAPC